MVVNRALLLTFWIIVGSPLLADSVPTVTLTEIDYHIPTLDLNHFGQGVLYNAEIGTGFLVMSDLSFDAPSPIFEPVSRGPFGPLPIPGTGSSDSVTGAVSGFLIGMPGRAFNFDASGSGGLIFAPVALPPIVTSSVFVSEPAMATGFYAASCVSTTSGPCPNPSLLANISLDISGTVNITLAPDALDDAYLISVNFTGTTVVPEPSSAWLVTLALALTAILFRYRKLARMCKMGFPPLRLLQESRWLNRGGARNFHSGSAPAPPL